MRKVRSVLNGIWWALLTLVDLERQNNQGSQGQDANDILDDEPKNILAGEAGEVKLGCVHMSSRSVLIESTWGLRTAFLHGGIDVLILNGSHCDFAV